jgi:hypothetical protein
MHLELPQSDIGRGRYDQNIENCPAVKRYNYGSARNYTMRPHGYFQQTKKAVTYIPYDLKVA